MTQIIQAFAKHTQNEFPPKFVFWSEPTGELHTTNIDCVEALSHTHSVIGTTDDFVTLKKKFSPANIPVLAFI